MADAADSKSAEGNLVRVRLSPRASRIHMALVPSFMPQRYPMVKQRILVADDDPGIRRTLQIGLTKAGYEVVEARDGAEAMRLWRDDGADLVISDIYMPDKDGLEVIRELRAKSPTTRVIAMTDGGRSKNLDPLRHSETFGASRTIAKPFTLEEMLAIVKQVLAG
jgi:DNA-binding response OmpR family regulator